MPVSLRMGLAQWAMLLLLSVLWGGSFFFVEVILDELPPLVLVASRVALAALALWIYVIAQGGAVPRGRRLWTAFLVMGAFNNVAPFALLAWGQSYVTGGLAAILNATTPLWGVMFANMMTRDEKATPSKVVGVLVGLAGVAVIMGPAAFGTSEIAVAGILPPLACIAAAILYGYTGVFGRRFAGLDPSVTAAAQLTSAALIAWPITLLVDRPWTLPMPGAHVLAAIAGLAFLSSAFAYVLYFRLLRSSGATNTLLVTQLVPVTAILLGAVFLGERLDPASFAGMALIALGLAIVDGRVIGLVRRLGGLRPRPH